jgi:hypothetical protein
MYLMSSGSPPATTLHCSSCGEVIVLRERIYLPLGDWFQFVLTGDERGATAARLPHWRRVIYRASSTKHLPHE